MGSLHTAFECVSFQSTIQQAWHFLGVFESFKECKTPLYAPLLEQIIFSVLEEHFLNGTTRTSN